MEQCKDLIEISIQCCSGVLLVELAICGFPSAGRDSSVTVAAYLRDKDRF